MFTLSAEGQNFVKQELGRYEHRYSAIIPALYRAQKENGGWVSAECIRHLCQIMDIPEAHIYEVAKFYTMFNLSPVGKIHVQVCCNISCAMNGGRELAAELERNLKENSDVTVSRVECLGSCGTAPMMQVNDTYYENLTPESAAKIIKELSR